MGVRLLRPARRRHGDRKLLAGADRQRLCLRRRRLGPHGRAEVGWHAVGWGSNLYGQLGDGTTTSQYSPEQIGSGFAFVAAGAAHTVAVKTDGTLWAWGWNSRGQLGDGTTIDRWSAQQIGSGFGVVAAGEAHTVGVKSDGTLWTWGYAQYGELADGGGSWTVPVQVQ